MNPKILIIGIVIAVVVASGCLGSQDNTKDDNTAPAPPPNKMKTAILETNKGTIKIELYTDKAPVTAANFIRLANGGFYSGLVFHRVIPGFMIQGGGFYPDGGQKASPYGAINLEINPALKHTDGAVAMARTNDPNSATSQFYICDGPQDFLNGNYAVFGQVTEGMDIVKSIASVKTATKFGYYSDWPVEDVLIESVRVE